MPLILDNIIVFLWRTVAHWIRVMRSRNWSVVMGKIDNIDCPDREMYPYTELHYCYKVGGEDFDVVVSEGLGSMRQRES
jgi:hypothetical protein